MSLDDLSPKYWCQETQSIEDGIQRRKAPFRLSSLCGTYRWVWYGHPECSQEVTESDNEEYGGIAFRRKTSTKPATPRNIAGRFQICLLTGTFGGLEVVKDPVTKLKVPNLWTVKRVKQSNPMDEFEFSSSDQQIFLSETLDDHGHPFLVFAYSEGEGCHGVCDYDIIAKKQRCELDNMDSAHWDGLTDDERERLEIDLTSSEIKEMVTEETEDEEEEKTEAAAD